MVNLYLLRNHYIQAHAKSLDEIPGVPEHIAPRITVERNVLGMQGIPEEDRIDFERRNGFLAAEEPEKKKFTENFNKPMSVSAMNNQNNYINKPHQPQSINVPIIQPSLEFQPPPPPPKTSEEIRDQVKAAIKNYPISANLIDSVKDYILSDFEQQRNKDILESQKTGKLIVYNYPKHSLFELMALKLDYSI
ncbi:MAG: hypothetical protein MHMPM18_003380 [Marteilia pararefringens]